MGTKLNLQHFLPITIFLILLTVSYFIIKPFVMILVLSALLAYTLTPINHYILKKTNKKNLTAVLMCLLVLLVIILPSTYMVKTLAEESYGVYVNLKEDSIINSIENCETNFCQSVKTFLNNEEINFQIEKVVSISTSYIIQKASNIVLSLPTLLINLFILLFTLFYFVRDGEKIMERVSYYLCMQKKNYLTVISRLKEVIHGILFGYILIAIIQGALGTLGFFVLGISSPIFWGIMMALLALIPYLGTGIVWLPAAAILLFQGMYSEDKIQIFKGIGLLVYGFAVISSVDNILRPKIISEKAKIHPAIVLVGIMGGLSFLGPFGVIIGPIALSLTAVIIETYLGHKPSKKELKQFFKKN